MLPSWLAATPAMAAATALAAAAAWTQSHPALADRPTACSSRVDVRGGVRRGRPGRWRRANSCWYAVEHREGTPVNVRNGSITLRPWIPRSPPARSSKPSPSSATQPPGSSAVSSPRPSRSPPPGSSASPPPWPDYPSPDQAWIEGLRHHRGDPSAAAGRMSRATAARRVVVKSRQHRVGPGRASPGRAPRSGRTLLLGGQGSSSSPSARRPCSAAVSGRVVVSDLGTAAAPAPTEAAAARLCPGGDDGRRIRGCLIMRRCIAINWSASPQLDHRYGVTGSAVSSARAWISALM